MDGIAYFFVPSPQRKETSSSSQLYFNHIVIVVSVEDNICVVDFPLLVVVQNPFHNLCFVLVFPFDGLVEDISEVVHGELAELKIISSFLQHMLYLNHYCQGYPLVFVLCDGWVCFVKNIQFLELTVELSNNYVVNI